MSFWLSFFFCSVFGVFLCYGRSVVDNIATILWGLMSPASGRTALFFCVFLVFYYVLTVGKGSNFQMKLAI